MADPIPGVDLGVPWPPVTNPDEVGNARSVSGPQIELPAGGDPPLETSPTTPPLGVENLPGSAGTVAPTNGVETLVVDVDRNIG